MRRPERLASLLSVLGRPDSGVPRAGPAPLHLNALIRHGGREGAVLGRGRCSQPYMGRSIDGGGAALRMRGGDGVVLHLLWASPCPPP